MRHLNNFKRSLEDIKFIIIKNLIVTRNWKVPKICSDANISPSFKTNEEKKDRVFRMSLKSRDPIPTLRILLLCL
jgi:hypothetical protein